MGYDSRFPHIHRIEHAPGLSTNEKRCAAQIAKRIGDNTGLKCSFNSRTGSLFFHYDPEPHGGPFSVPFKDPHDGFRHTYSDAELGDFIRMAKYGQLERAEKDEIAARNKREEDYQNQQKQQALMDERRPCAEDFVAHRDRARRGVEKVISV